MGAETVVTKSTISADVLDMFPGIETGSVLTGQKPANILSSDNNLSFLDKPGAVKLTDPPNNGDGDKDKGAGAAAAGTQTPAAGAAGQQQDPPPPPANQSEADKILNSFRDAPPGDNEGAEGEGEGEGEGGEGTGAAGEAGKGKGRDAITSYLKSKIEAGQFQAFEDWDEKKETLDQYLAKQPVKSLHQMLDANWEAKEQELLERTPKEFFEALPEELQYAAKYVMEGGTDMKGIFAALARVEQVKSLDISTEEGQIATARAYLQATGFGGGKPERIEKQVNEWKEAGKLEEKATEFKPDLDEMQKEQVQYQLQQQEQWNKQRRDAAMAYMGNVHKALEKADINGIKLDKKTQNALYNGLTQVSYPSASGQPTNLLGHLLDKIQYVEPNFALLAEVTYLLSDPEGYRNSIKQMGRNDQVVDTVRQLKTQQQLGTSSQPGEDGDTGADDSGKKKTTKLAKPKNIFER